jgi:hypothetical protein
VERAAVWHKRRVQELGLLPEILTKTGVWIGRAFCELRKRKAGRDCLVAAMCRSWKSSRDTS